MKLKRVLAVLLAVTCAVAVWLRVKSVHQLQRPASGSNESTPPVAQRADREADTSSSTDRNPNENESSLDERLRDVARQLSATQTPAKQREILNRLRLYLASLERNIAVTTLREFLNGGTDVATKLDFTISPGGRLKEAPTLRVWLLDCLGQIDRNASAEYARKILSQSAAPDEWAVSLRDFALVRNKPEDVVFVQSKVRELINNPAWQQKPSAGFLEAFDTIVYTRATNLTTDLTRLVTLKENRAVAHAAYLTLDRLVLEEPEAVLTQLASNPDTMRGREQTRANYFARADLRDPQQRALVESYLLDPRRSPQELQTFAGIYPNANLMISNNLLTKTQTPGNGDIAAHDREALKIVKSWLVDSRFARIKPQIEQIHSRLSAFVQQPGAVQNAGQ